MYYDFRAMENQKFYHTCNCALLYMKNNTSTIRIYIPIPAIIENFWNNIPSFKNPMLMCKRILRKTFTSKFKEMIE